ncbi:MAG: 4'-phosphopantetheinyl transferase superfamily protein [Nitrososphaerota archaeon]|nr:4'-phosphopantetheinyl transferase superfamily protein [Nitrososphaerota archaeon]
MFKVVVIRGIEGFCWENFEFLLSFVSAEKQKRIRNFRSFMDATRCLLGDILVRILLCRVTGLGNSKLEFGVNFYGKPFLANVSGVYFNVSHVGDCVVCAVSDVPVGIDIEVVRSVDVVGVAERFFTFDEQAYVLSASRSVVLQRFFEVWTKKESIMKCHGTSLFESLSSLSVLRVPEMENCFFHRVYNADGFVCYVCLNKDEMPLLEVVDVKWLLEQVRFW